MSFLNAFFLWGLPLIAVPVIIHLLNRRRQETVRWGAMKFLLEAVPRRRRIWRLNDLLLMLLRAAMVALFVLALAQPLLKTNLFGGGQGRQVVLILDDSLSTARIAGDGTVFDRIQTRASALIDAMSSGDRVRVMLASGSPRWLGPELTVGADTRAELRRLIEAVEPTQGSANLLATVRLATEAPASDPNITRLVTIIGDGQAHGWNTAGGSAWNELRKKLESAPLRTLVSAIAVEADPVPNLSADALEASRSVVAVDQMVLLTATARNHGQSDSQPATLAWQVNGKPIGVTSLLPIAPDGQATATVQHRFDTPGWYTITSRITVPDGLPADNGAACVIEVVESVPILVVDPMPGRNPLASESGLLLGALGEGRESQRQWRSALRPKVIHEAQLLHEPLENYRCIVLANVTSVQPAAVTKLASFVQAGGGLWICLGDRTDPDALNGGLLGAPSGLAQVTLGSAVGDVNRRNESASVRVPDSRHPANRLISDAARLDLTQVKILRRFALATTVEPEKLGVLLETTTGEPIAVEKTLGRGRVITQALPLNLRWSNLPACQVFVVLANEWLWHLVEPTGTDVNLAVGEPFQFVAGGAKPEEPAMLTLPDGRPVPMKREVRDGRTTYRFARTTLPGDYLLRLAEPSTTPVPFHVRREPEESNLTPLSDEDRALLAEASGIRFGGDPLDVPAVDDASHMEPIWTALMIALAAFFVLESLLAFLLARRKFVRSPLPPVMSAWGVRA